VLLIASSKVTFFPEMSLNGTAGKKCDNVEYLARVNLILSGLIFIPFFVVRYTAPFLFNDSMFHVVNERVQDCMWVEDGDYFVAHAKSGQTVRQQKYS